MNRRAFVTGLGAVLTAPRGAEGQRAEAFRIGVIQTTDTREAVALWQITKDRLRELGYVEGRNIHFLHRSAAGTTGRLPAIAADLMKDRPDVLLAGSLPAVAAAVEATNTVPIVAVAAGPISQVRRFRAAFSLTTPLAHAQWPRSRPA